MKKHKTAKTQVTCQKTESFEQQISELNKIAAKRIGGSVNIGGIGFQLLYAASTSLKYLTNGQANSIRLEGLEDLDVHANGISDFVQVKTSINEVDAHRFWNMRILLNFYELYKTGTSGRFRVVHNFKVSKGTMDAFRTGKFSPDVLAYWRGKFAEKNITISDSELTDLLSRISFERTSEVDIYRSIVALLHDIFSVNNGTELNYIRALFYHLFDWSKMRKTVTASDLQLLMQNTTDSFSRFPVNESLRNNWISKISYSIPEGVAFNNDYYDGKAARPVDIALGLNVRRPVWEEAIGKSISDFDVTVVKSSSGQGKSTLAFQAGKNAGESNHSVYQLNHCTSDDQANHIVDFIETRLKIGEAPLIIVDGLSQTVYAWDRIAVVLRDKPVKFILTTREEDWSRYIFDMSGLSLNLITILLSEMEAMEIFHALRQNGKLDKAITDWQPAWERVRDNGLLIEYIFLLTQGQMIADRLSMQVKRINTEKDAGAKLEIVRLVTIADTLNVRLKTTNLTEFIRTNFVLQSDRNELYRQLEKEYYMSFDDSYVHGLHPVRSRHLVDILNSSSGITTPLISVLQIISEDSVYDYFANLLITFPSLAFDEFCPRAVSVVVHWKFPVIVRAIDGLMCNEPYKYWAENRSIFDEAFNKGGFLLFLYQSMPFMKINILENMLDGLGEAARENMHKRIALLKALPQYSFLTSSVYLFVDMLGKMLVKRLISKDYNGVASLLKWFNKVGVDFPGLIEIDEEQMLKDLAEKEVLATAEAFQYYFLTKPLDYQRFIDQNYDVIVSLLKKRSDCLSVYVDNGDLNIRYILDTATDKAVDASVKRIELFHLFLPGHLRYCTEPVILPFPNEAIFYVVKNDGSKYIPVENLYDDFDSRVNNIWIKTIENQYCMGSSYEWQKQYYDFRLLLINVLRLVTRLFEAHLEKKQSRIKVVSDAIEDQGTAWLQWEFRLKRFPPHIDKELGGKSINSLENEINEFISWVRTFLDQLPSIFKTGDFHLPIINLNSAITNIGRFQRAYIAIAGSTQQYFDITEIETDEQAALIRLGKTVKFCEQYFKGTDHYNIAFAKNNIENWWDEQLESQLNIVRAIVEEMGRLSGFKLLAPNRVVQEKSLKFVVIGVEGCDLSDDSNFLRLSLCASLFLDTDISFITFAFIKNLKTGYTLRVSKDYLQKIVDLSDGKEINNDDGAIPIPLPADEELVRYLDGITLEDTIVDKHNENFYKMMTDTWKLLQYRQSLDENNGIEKDWLASLEIEYSASIEELLRTVKQGPDDVGETCDDIMSFLRKKKSLSTDNILAAMNNKAMITVKRTFGPAI